MKKIFLLSLAVAVLSFAGESRAAESASTVTAGGQSIALPAVPGYTELLADPEIAVKLPKPPEGIKPLGLYVPTASYQAFKAGDTSPPGTQINVMTQIVNSDYTEAAFDALKNQMKTQQPPAQTQIPASLDQNQVVPLGVLYDKPHAVAIGILANVPDGEGKSKIGVTTQSQALIKGHLLMIGSLGPASSQDDVTKHKALVAKYLDDLIALNPDVPAAESKAPWVK